MISNGTHGREVEERVLGWTFAVDDIEATCGLVRAIQVEQCKKKPD